MLLVKEENNVLTVWDIEHDVYKSCVNVLHDGPVLMSPDNKYLVFKPCNSGRNDEWVFYDLSNNSYQTFIVDGTDSAHPVWCDPETLVFITGQKAIVRKWVKESLEFFRNHVKGE